MFKKILFLLFILSLFMTACQFSNNNGQSPVSSNVWIENFIAQEQKKPALEQAETISRCEYQNKTVYHVIAPCCDQFNTLYDEKGVVLCSPDGGITGQGDGQCLNFSTEAKNCQKIWEKNQNQ